MNALREAIRWIWWVVSIADALAALLAWWELRSRQSRSFAYLGRTQFGDAWRASVTIIGLYLFGLNVQSHMWFLIFGLCASIYQGYATVCWLLFIRGTINGDGCWKTIINWIKRKASKRDVNQ